MLNFTSSILSKTVNYYPLTMFVCTFGLCVLNNPAWGQIKTAEIVNHKIEEDKVTIRVKLKDENEKPIPEQIARSKFSLKVKDYDRDKTYKNVKIIEFLNPQESKKPAARIVVLLDMSGSMKSKDSSNTRKLDGAITAIEKFIKEAKNLGGDTQIAIVPFGEPHDIKCPKGKGGYSVDETTLNKNKFFPAGDVKNDNFLRLLKAKKDKEICAFTDLYKPLIFAINFFKNEPTFQPSKSQDANKTEQIKEPPPKLAVILLSDGFHTPGKDAEYFKELEDSLQNTEITVHTLGYGLTPEELGEKYKLGHPATRNDVKNDVNDDINPGLVPSEEFVDRDLLKKMAQLTGGIGEFSQDADKIAKSLNVFLDSILGEYEITYFDPYPERGAIHGVSVSVTVKDNKSITSEPENYRTIIFGTPVKGIIRLGIIGGIILILGVGGVMPFYFWGKHIKNLENDN